MSDLSGLLGKRIRATVIEGGVRKFHKVAYVGLVDREIKDEAGRLVWVVIRRNTRPSSDRYIGDWHEITVLEPSDA
jgi:hypothetical protein